MKSFFTVAALLLSTQLLAHEGHDHVPGVINAPHGGLVKQAGGNMLELVMTADGVQLFPFDLDMKPIAPAKLKVQGKMSLPKKKPQAVNFETQGDKFVAKVDAKGSHRYDLEVTITSSGKSSKAKFTVEPK